MRLRVRCGTAYKLGDLQWCMVHVPEHLHTVRDLAMHISKLLELDSHCVGSTSTEPPQLLLEGFLVPHEEEVQAVLRDDEVVDLEPCEPASQGLLSLAAQPAWGSPIAAANGKRASETGVSGTPGEKRPRLGGKGGASAPAAMAIGWQSPGAVSAPAQSPGAASQASRVAAPKAKAAAAEESSSDDSSEEEAATPAAKAAKAKASAGEAARRIAMATCGDACAGAEAAEAASASASGGGAEGETGIFVGGIAPNIVDSQLQTYFEQYGEVASASVVFNNSTGKSKGYAFLEFAHASSAAKVLGAGPKLQWGDREIEVKPRIAKGAGGKGKGKDGKGKDSKGKDKGKDKGKAGKGDTKDKTKGNSAAASKALEDSDDSSDDSSDEAAPKAAAKAASPPATPAPKKVAKKAPEEAPEISSEELEVQRQMAALGLPVSFTATAALSDDEGDEDDEEEEEA